VSALGGGYESGVTLYLRLPAEPVSAREARRAVTTWAQSRGVGPELDDLSLVTSELVANAASHGTGPVTVEAVHSGDAIRLKVTDSGECPNVAPRDPQLDDDRGRGLLIVAALARAWGSSAGNGSTEVWAELFIGRH